MKKAFPILLFFLISSFYSFSQTTGSDHKRAPGTEGKDPHPEAAINSVLPAFRMMLPDKSIYSSTDIPVGNSVIFAMFNPTCDHCVNTGRDIFQKLDSLKNTTIIFITFTGNFNDLNQYLMSTGLVNNQQVHVGVANDQFILGHFMPNYIIPQVMVYNKKKKLKKILYETISTDEVMRYLAMP